MLFRLFPLNTHFTFKICVKISILKRTLHQETYSSPRWSYLGKIISSSLFSEVGILTPNLWYPQPKYVDLCSLFRTPFLTFVSSIRFRVFSFVNVSHPNSLAFSGPYPGSPTTNSAFPAALPQMALLGFPYTDPNNILLQKK